MTAPIIGYSAVMFAATLAAAARVAYAKWPLKQLDVVDFVLRDMSD